MLSGNPAGFFLAASGAMSFGKGTGWQIGSQFMGLAGSAILLSQAYNSPALADSQGAGAKTGASSGQSTNAGGLGGLQFAAASGGEVASDAPRFAASTDIGELWGRVMGPLEKAVPVAGAVSTGAALMTTGLYLIQQSFGLVPTAGPIAAGLTAAAGLVTLGGGFALEVGAVYMGYELFIKPNPRVPGTVSGGK